MTTLGLAAASPLSEGEHQVQLTRAVVASTIGTAIEWYDFFLYSTMTGLVFAKLFFPRSDPLVGTPRAHRQHPTRRGRSRLLCRHAGTGYRSVTQTK
jgi:hypothetical protein